MLRRPLRSIRGDTAWAVFLLVTLVLVILIVALMARDRWARSGGATPSGEAESGETRVGETESRDPRALPPGFRPAESDWRSADVGGPSPARSGPRGDTTEIRRSDDTARARDDWPDRVDIRTGGAEPSGRPPSRAGASVSEQRVRNAENMVATLVRAVARFREIMGRNARDLSELTRPVPGYVEGVFGAAGVPNDPWGRPYVYGGRTGATGPVWVRCLGADGREGGLGFDRDLVASFED